jgi:hypothetical protein
MDRCAVLVSFEGPDWYAWHGGLAQRVVALAAEFASRGWLTHHVYLGDPKSPGTESLAAGRLTLHRWAQWLSASYPEGVYHGEEAKAEELARSLPSFLVELLAPVIAAGVTPTVIAEEWQTAPFVAAFADELREAGLAAEVELVWRAGSKFGWERVGWDKLGEVARISGTTPEICQALAERNIAASLMPAEPHGTIAALAPRPQLLLVRSPLVRPARRRTRDVPTG